MITQQPIVLLTNSGTASASEVLAGALHDHQRYRFASILQRIHDDHCMTTGIICQLAGHLKACLHGAMLASRLAYDA